MLFYLNLSYKIILKQEITDFTYFYASKECIYLETLYEEDKIKEVSTMNYFIKKKVYESML